MPKLKPDEKKAPIREAMRKKVREPLTAPERERVGQRVFTLHPVVRLDDQSVMWTRAAIACPRLTPGAKALAALLGWTCDHRGVDDESLDQLRACLPGQDGTPASEQSVRRWRKQLVKEGFLLKLSEGRGAGITSVYQLTFPVLELAETADLEGLSVRFVDEGADPEKQVVERAGEPEESF